MTTPYPQQQQGVGEKVPPPPPPGYVYNTGSGPAPQGTQYVYSTQTYDSTGSIQSLRTAIPELPMCLAITLCIINCIIPGVGTIIAGFSVLCCGNVGQENWSRFGTFCLNFWVGIAQIVTIVFGVGWVWSIFWGFAFIAIAAEAKKKKEAPTTVTVVNQSLPGQNTATVY